MRTLLLCLFLWIGTSYAHGYSVLAHEAIIDSAWSDSIVPVLKQRFPRATEMDLQECRQYAYGGSLIQDMGYYPFGSKFFTDLLHYVRSADFISALLEESENLNEFAFSLGALSHYISDTTGHANGTNRVVPILFPELRKKYGSEITYEEKPSAHLKAEFGYDVLQVARGRYAMEAYHEFIGFSVALPVLERAFRKTYGLEMKDLFGDMDLTIGTYRHTVSELVPELTKVAWELKEDEIREAIPEASAQTFLFRISRDAYEKEWGGKYRKPGCFVRFVAFLIRILPKVGPLKTLHFRPPTPETESMFRQSMDKTELRYAEMLKQVRKGTLQLQNQDLDTGRPTRAGEYGMADNAYAKLVKKLDEKNFAQVSPGLKTNILSFYDSAGPGVKNQKKWRKLQPSIDRLRKLHI